MTTVQAPAPPVLQLVTALRLAIINGQLLPGQRLVESELTGMFHVTRAAVRSALIFLEGEGLIEREFNRGARVRVITLSEAIEIIETRAVLDGLCAAKAAERATKAERRALTQLGAQMKASVDAEDVIAYNGLAQGVHRRIREYARHSTTSEVVDRLRYQSVRHQFSIDLMPERPKVVAREHLEIIRAVSDGAADDAERLMRRHFTTMIDAMRVFAQRRAAAVVDA
jgi:DNA-binding GntR family transcriptional regulator